MTRRSRFVTIGVLIFVGLAAGGTTVFFLVRPSQDPSIAAAFEQLDEEWPPQAPADLATELAVTRAELRLSAAGLAPDPDPDHPAYADDVRGIRVRTGFEMEFFYIEAVFGDANFDDPMPMAVLIHGRGDRARIPGGPFWGLSAPLRVIVPQAPDPLGRGYEWLPVRVGSGLVDRLTTALIARAGELAQMIRTLRDNLPTVGKPMVVGFSQGGLLTFALATHYTDMVGAAFPLSAWLPPALLPPYRRDDLAYPPIRGVHGEADRIIPLNPTREVFDSLQERGFEAELVTFPGVEHEMSEDMNVQLHAWLSEALGVVVEQGVRDGLLDGGLPACDPYWRLAPDGGWPDGGSPYDWPEPPDGGWPQDWRPSAWPEAGWPDGSVWDCPDAGSVDAGILDAAASDGGMDAGVLQHGDQR